MSDNRTRGGSPKFPFMASAWCEGTEKVKHASDDTEILARARLAVLCLRAANKEPH